MIKIPIDDIRYHGNRLSQKELLWAWETYCKVCLLYKNLTPFVNTTLKPLQLSEYQKKKLLTEVTVAFSHYAKVNFSFKTEQEFYALIKKWFCIFLPYIVENVSTIKASHPVQYEPIALTNIYVVSFLQTTLENDYMVLGQDKFSQYFALELLNAFRALRSLTVLLTIGDDVHGMALLRGVFEIFAKIQFAEEFSEEYVLFKEFNAYLQDYKHNNKPLPAEMTNYLKDEKEFSKNKENFLAYGWAKNKKGKRIVTMRELFVERVKNKDIEKLFQVSSEFVHEDYVCTNYDYIAIRKYLVDVCFYICNDFADNILKSLSNKKVKHLIKLAKEYYRGEF